MGVFSTSFFFSFTKNSFRVNYLFHTITPLFSHGLDIRSKSRRYKIRCVFLFFYFFFIGIH
jgi:hypothetical protein